MKKQLTTIAILFLGSFGAACLLVPKAYRGYWFKLPSADWSLSSIDSVERFTTFNADSVQSGQLALKHSVNAKNDFHRNDDRPIHNLPVAIVERGLTPTSSEPVLATTLEAIHKNLELQDVLVEGESGYPNAKILQGHVVTGQGEQGDSVIVAALWGDQASNDHYPYYEALFETLPNGELQLLDARQYWFDIAGLEDGAVYILAGFVGFCFGSVLSILYGSVLCALYLRKRLSRKAA